MPRRILYPFASSGDFREIPDADTTSSGAVTYQTGYGIDYQKRLDVESGAKNIDRSGFNGVLFDTTENIKSWQDQAFPDWYNPTGSATDQGYKKKSVVRYTDGNLYVSKINNNRDLPTNSASWEYQYTTQEILATIPQIYRGVAPSSGDFQSSTFQMNGVWDFPTDAMIAGYANTPPGALAGYLTVKVTDGAGKGSFTYYDRTGQIFSMGYDSSLGKWIPWNKKAVASEVFLTNFPVVTAATNWNSLTSSGSYAVSVATGPNSPGVNSLGNLLVSSVPGQSSIAQTFTYDGAGRTAQYTRVYVGGWTAWTYGSTDKVPFSGGTMTGALALFGGSTAPTQGQAENSTKIASTAYVKAASGNLVAYTPVQASRAVTASDIGKSLYCVGPGMTITMPSPEGLGLPDNGGRCVWFFGYNDSFLVNAAPGVNINYNVGVAQSVTVKTGQFLMLMATNANIWQVVNSTADMFRNADFVNYFNEVATTQPRFNNTTKIATTEYVNRVGLSAAYTVAITAGSYALDSTYGGVSLYNNGSGLATVTLPASPSVKTGTRIEFISISGAIFISPPAGSNMYIGSGQVASVILQIGDTLTLESNGVGSWIGVLGSVQLRYSKDFANYFAELASTAPLFDNTTKIANTAFVKRASGNFSKVRVITANTVLTLDDMGSFIEVGGTGNVTLTLPSPLSSGNCTVNIQLNTQYTLTVQTPSGNIFVNGSSAASQTFSGVGTSLALVSDGGSWTQYGNTGTLVSTGGASGYQKLPSGLIIQWMSFDIPASSGANPSYTNFTFPIPFRVACFGVTASPSGIGFGLNSNAFVSARADSVVGGVAQNNYTVSSVTVFVVALGV